MRATGAASRRSSPSGTSVRILRSVTREATLHPICSSRSTGSRRASALGRDAQRAAGFDGGRVERVLRVARELERLAKPRTEGPRGPAEHESALLRVVLAGYPDRVGRLRKPDTSTGRRGVEIVLAAGGTAALAESSVVRSADLVVAVDAEERNTNGRDQVVVRWASRVDEDLVLELLTDAIDDERETVFVPERGRVEEVRRLRLGALTLDEQRGPPHDIEAASRALASAALADPSRAADLDDVSRIAARLAFLARARPDLGLPLLDDAKRVGAMASACEGRASLSDIGDHALTEAVHQWLGPERQRRLAELAPGHVTLPSGRSVAVSYPPDAPPAISARLQDFFGMRDGPRVAGGAVPLVLHLLAPNQRDVQVTTDLAGFWAKHYPALARELRRKYPRHPFPDDPLSASPPPPRRR